MKRTFVLLFGLLIIEFTISAQSFTNSQFWKGMLSSSNDCNLIYFLIDDSVFQIKDKTWLKKCVLNSSNGIIADLKVDKNGNVWAFYSNSIKVSKDNCTSFQEFTRPADAGINAFFSGDYLYLKKGGKVYGRNVLLKDANWEIIYESGYMDFAATANGTLYVTLYDRKILKSTDKGKTWNETNWSSTNEFSTSGKINVRENKLFVGTYWGVLYISNDEGNTWFKSKGLPAGKGVSDVFISSKNMVFVLVRDQISTVGLFVSYDDGLNFTKLNYGLTTWTEQFITGFVTNGDEFYVNAGYRGFFYSPDKGLTWKEINNNINNLKPHHVQKIQMDSNGNTWVLMAQNGIGPRIGWGVLKSVDKGATWEEADSSLIDQYMTFEDLLVTPNGKAIAANYTPGTISISSDGGRIWNTQVVQTGRTVICPPCNICPPCSAELIRSTVSKLKTYKSNDTIFGGTYWDGVIRTYDGGKNWTKLSNGIPLNSGVDDLLVLKDTIYAIIASQLNYDGIYK